MTVIDVQWGLGQVSRRSERYRGLFPLQEAQECGRRHPLGHHDSHIIHYRHKAADTLNSGHKTLKIAPAKYLPVSLGREWGQKGGVVHMPWFEALGCFWAQ